MPLSAFSDVMHILSWVISGCLQLLEIYWKFIVPPGNFLTDDVSILIKFDLQCRRYSVNINSCMNDHICNTLVTAVVSGWSNTLFFIKLPTARRLYSLTMSVCLSVHLFVLLSVTSEWQFTGVSKAGLPSTSWTAATPHRTLPVVSDFDLPSATISSYCSTLGRQAFSLTGPMAWNALPDNLRDLSLSADNFRKMLKTHLFRNALGHLAH